MQDSGASFHMQGTTDELEACREVHGTIAYAFRTRGGRNSYENWNFGYVQS